MAISVFSVLIYNALQTTSNPQITVVLNRLLTIIISISAIVIAILWIPIALGFFTSDENKRYEAKSRLKNALIGTLIYVLAVSGVIYAVFNYVATGVW